MRAARPTVLILPALVPTGALAHVGHVAEVAGHSHWIAGAAVGIAVLVGLWGRRKDRKTEDRDEDAAPESDEAEA